MKLSVLLNCNRDWSEDDVLVIVTKDDLDPAPLRPRFARSVFGEREVIWFKDRVVMVE